jgi:ATP sulfurylase
MENPVANSVILTSSARSSSRAAPQITSISRLNFDMNSCNAFISSIINGFFSPKERLMSIFFALNTSLLLSKGE